MIFSTQTINRLRRELAVPFHVVPQPDHPMLLSGPDLLIGGEGKLTAVILVSKITSAKSLSARIMAIRLAMPTNTRLIAILEDDAQPPIGLLRNFDEIARTERAWLEIARYAKSDAEPKLDKRALSENKRRHSEKYTFAMLLATLRRKHELPITEPAAVIRGLENMDQLTSHQGTKRTSPRRPSTHVQGVQVTSITSRTKPVQQLRTLCNDGLIDSYVLDTGVPYQSDDSNLNVLLVEEWPSVRHDPEKPIRAAAFACWIMARSSSAEDIFSLIERSREQKYLRKWRYA